MRLAGPWKILGIEPTEDNGAIRRAYARKLKALDIDREIEAYAALRQARDHALSIAKKAAGAATQDVPRYERDAREAHPASNVAFAAQNESDASTSAEPREPIPPEILRDILFPNGEYSDDALSHEDWMTGEAAVAAIAAEAHESPIDKQAAIDEWMAHHLAMAWPRSAPFVSGAAQLFGWMEDSGQLGERDAVLFLNTRLRGLRFLEKVQEPKHPFYRAWKILSQPGAPGKLDFLRASRDDVARLLKGIRQRYPEIESYLNPRQVQSWERAEVGAIADGSDRSGYGVWWLVALAVIAIGRAVSTIPGTLPPEVENALPAPASGAVFGQSQVEALMKDLFGDDGAHLRLDVQAPILASHIRLFRLMAENGDDGLDRQRMKILNILRIQALFAADRANFSDLVGIKRVKLALLVQPSVRSTPSLCEDIINGRIVDEIVPATEAIRARERALHFRLIDQGLLKDEPDAGPRSAPIPGFILDEVLRTSGLSREAVELAAQGKAGSVDFCRYRIALMESVLRQPSKVSSELLRLL